MQYFDSLWNYSDPAATEKLFQKALEQSVEQDMAYRLELMTQIARTYSLRGQTATAHEILDKIHEQLKDEMGVAMVRYHLERGRAYNTGGEKENAYESFVSAREAAAALNEDFYEADALHMLAIVTTGETSVQFNLRAIDLCSNSKQERAKTWMGSLLNNLGWNYFDAGDFEKALSTFLHALKWREEMKQEKAVFLAKWCVARTLRALNRADKAITIQLGLMEEMLEKGTPDGYVYEELAELHLLKHDALSKMYFGLAWQELSKDSYLEQIEPSRLERMKELAK